MWIKLVTIMLSLHPQSSIEKKEKNMKIDWAYLRKG